MFSPSNRLFYYISIFSISSTLSISVSCSNSSSSMSTSTCSTSPPFRRRSHHSSSSSTCLSSRQPSRRRRADVDGLSSSSSTSLTSRQPSRRRHVDQLVDGLSQFFTAVGKRRSCVPVRLRPDFCDSASDIFECQLVGMEQSGSGSGYDSPGVDSVTSGPCDVARIKLKRLSVDMSRDLVGSDVELSSNVSSAVPDVKQSLSSSNSKLGKCFIVCLLQTAFQFPYL